MELRFATYEKKYLKSCADIVRVTWNFAEDLDSPRRPDLIDEYYVQSCVDPSEHLELIVDESDEVKGILFGSIEDAAPGRKLVSRLRGIRLKLWCLFHILTGDFGKRATALRFFEDMREINRAGETNDRHFDSEINLLILSPELRGQGYGRNLMERYFAFCKKNDLHSAFLWTTNECTYSFYEKYGFTLYKRFHYGAFTDDRTGGDNCMTYCIEID